MQYIYVAIHDQAVYFTFSRGKEVILLEVTIFTKNSILDVWKGSEYVVAQ